jgi:hypothetical protein
MIHETLHKKLDWATWISQTGWGLHPVTHVYAVTPKFHTVTDNIFTYILNMP